MSQIETKHDLESKTDPTTVKEACSDVKFIEVKAAWFSDVKFIEATAEAFSDVRFIEVTAENVQKASYDEQLPLRTADETYRNKVHRPACQKYKKDVDDLIFKYITEYKKTKVIDLNSMYAEFVIIQDRMNEAHHAWNIAREEIWGKGNYSVFTPNRTLDIFFTQVGWKLCSDYDLTDSGSPPI